MAHDGGQGGLGGVAGVEVLMSASERQFIADGVEQGVRPDGRDRMAAREFHVQTGVIPHANGSASLRCGGTRVVVGVKAELATPDKNTPNRGRIQVSVKCSTTASPAFEGRAGEDLSTELSFAMNRMLGAGMNAKVYESLCVKEGQQCWNLFADAVVLDYDGSLLDAVSLATYAALADTALPKVKAFSSQDGEVKIDVADAIEDCEFFDVSSVPVFITLVQIGKRFVVDAVAVEEASALARLCVGVTAAGKVCCMHKSQGRGMHPMLVVQMTKGAVEVGKDRIEKLDRKLAQLKAASAVDDIYMDVEQPVFS